MRNSCIIRRIDDVGRIIIPKEIRRNLQVEEGTPFEITVDKNGSIILTPRLTKNEKVEYWKNKVYKRIRHDTAELEFHYHGSAIVCARTDKINLFPTTIGIAVCAPNDEYNEFFGQCLAYCRTADIPIPDFIFED